MQRLRRLRLASIPLAPPEPPLTIGAAVDTAPSRFDRRYIIVAVCCISAFITQLDTSVLNVALPSIQRSFTSSLAGLQWVTDGFVLALCCFGLLSGSLADRYGRRKMFRIGLLIFLLGSILCSTAPTLGFLVVARFLQGSGGSMLNANAVSIIANAFSAAPDRAKALGVWSSVSGISLASGPLIGGALIQGWGWRAIFWINVPIIGVVLWLSKRYLPESKAEVLRRFDAVGQVLIVIMLSTLTYGIIEAPNKGWTSTEIVALFAVAAVAFMVFIAVELRIDQPSVELRLFRSPPFSAASITAVLTFVALAGFLFLNSVYLQDVRGDSAFSAGLTLVPSMAMFAVLAPISGRVVARFGPKPPLVVGGILIGLGAIIMANIQASTNTGVLLIAYLLIGSGLGTAIPPINFTALAGMPRSQAGLAGGITGVSRSIGTTLGVAVLGSLVASRYHDSVTHVLGQARLSSGQTRSLVSSGVNAANHAAASAIPLVHGLTTPLRVALADALHPSWWVAVGAAGLLVVVSAVTTGPRGQARARLVLSEDSAAR